MRKNSYLTHVVREIGRIPFYDKNLEILKQNDQALTERRK